METEAHRLHNLPKVTEVVESGSTNNVHKNLQSDDYTHHGLKEAKPRNELNIKENCGASHIRMLRNRLTMLPKTGMIYF